MNVCERKCRQWYSAFIEFYLYVLVKICIRVLKCIYISEAKPKGKVT